MVLVFALILFGCGATTTEEPAGDRGGAEVQAERQRVVTIKDFFASRSRLESVAFRILKSNAALCRDRLRLASGFNALTRHEVPEQYRGAAAKAYDLGERLRVVYVSPGTPARAAGLVAGDILAEVDGTPIPEGPGARRAFGTRLLAAASRGSPVDLVVMRGNSRRQLALAPERVCAYEVRLIINDLINAFADGESVVLTTGMMWFAQTDEELAAVVGHELAHNLLNHVDKKRRAASDRLIADLAAAGLGANDPSMFSRVEEVAYGEELEREADYLGLYLTARAGFRIDDAPNFWRRTGIDRPGSIRPGLAANHPPSPARFVGLVNTVREINAKRLNGQPLTPDFEGR